jgi:WD40 repeat protein/serine/threonine protein kinase/class 3 adenylate cyclase
MTQTDSHGNALRSRLLTLVFTDLVDSVGLKSRLGDAEAGRLIASHLEGVRQLAQQSGGREILAAGDGCFLTFETPSEAVEFAIALQDFHRQHTSLPDVRIGIHMGEVTERLNTAGSPRPLDVEGLAVDIASRIQSIAAARQILLSYPVFDNARQRLDSSRWPMPVEWRAHGRYIFQGTEMAFEVFEVGLKGIGPFTPPTGGSKAHRDVQDPEEEATLGWRPAQGLPLPGRPNWMLGQKLGEGGFGDVWLVEHRKTHERHVVKFCYSADRLRALKREVTLFRLLKESLGNREDIARVLDFQFETTPYFLEMEYAGEYTLGEWLLEQGGAREVPLKLRLEIISQIADAVAAAHSTGVLHKDIKPSNIMIVERPNGAPQIKMIDFGIGALEDRRVLDGRGITATGLTDVESQKEYGSSLTGTRLYMAPELIEGKPATTRSDIYSLGVLLYQMVSGKMGQALAPGWERDIPDDLLREDIASCVDGEPDKRLKSADELAWRLRHLDERYAERDAEAERARQEVLRHQRHRRARIIGLFSAGGMLILLTLFALYAMLQKDKAASESILRQNAEAARAHAETQEQKTQVALQKVQLARYFSAIALAEASLRESRYQKAQDVLLDDPPADLLRREWGWLMAQTAPEDFALRESNFYDAEFTPDGKQILVGSSYRAGRGFVAFYDASTAEQTTLTETNDRLVWNLAIDPAGILAATASSDKVISIVDLKARNIVTTLRGHTGIVRDVAFSPDSRLLASCARDSTVRLWNVNNLKLDRVISVGQDSPTELDFSPDSRYVVTGSLEGNVRVFDVTSGTQVCSLVGSKERVLSVGFLDNGAGIATASTDGFTFLYRWPPPAGQAELQPYLKIASDDTYPSQVVSSPDGKAVYVGNDNGRVSKIDAETGNELLDFTVDQPLWKISLSPDGRKMLTTTRWSMRMLDLERLESASTATAVRSPLRDIKDLIPITAETVPSTRDQTWRGDLEWRTTSGLTRVVTSTGKKFLVNSEYVVYSPDRLQYIKINPITLRWRARETSSGKSLLNMKHHLCVGVQYSPDGEKLAVLYEKEKTVVYNTSTWNAIFSIPSKNSPVSAIFTSDSRRLIIGDLNGEVTEYSAFNGKALRKLTDKGIGMPMDFDIAVNEKLLAIGTDQDRAHVIDLETGDQISTMAGHVRYVHGVKFTPDSNRLTTLSRDGTVKLWDVKTGRELVTLFSLKNGVLPLGIYFAPGGRSVNVVTSDRKILSTEVFPWNLDIYGSTDTPLIDRIEQWKRKQRLRPEKPATEISATVDEMSTGTARE